MKALLSALLFAVALAFTTPASAQALKIGVVDVQKAIQTVPEGKAAKQKLEADAKRIQSDIDKQQNELKTMKDELERQAALLQDAVKREKMKLYQQKLMQLQEGYVKNQQDLKEKEGKLLKPILEKITKTAEAVAKAEGYTLIVEKGAVLFAVPAIDITDTVIARYGK
ncbi:MAG: OmpH family outer membrane protein [Myxococcales bacterium]|nr:OmpH family outer membrane protein [Myxococcales bacterium]